MMMHRAVLIGMLAMLVAGCSFAGQRAEKRVDEDEALVVEGNNRFALQLYQKLRSGDGNLFFSPYSISTALAMTYAGARGQTETQMAETLGFATSAEVLARIGASGKPLTRKEFADAFGHIIKGLNARGDEAQYQLRVANALWGQKDYESLSSFTKGIEAAYGGKLQELDFVTGAEQARKTINAWVEKQTNDKIKDLISPGVLDAMTRLVLTNAIYFKGNWASQFEKDRTREAPFTLRDGEKVQVPMMNQRARFGYAETDALQVLELPYVGEELSMVILLPRETDGIDALEGDLTAENLATWLGRIRKREVIVSVPRFKMTSKFGLASVLASMGMPLAFSRNADFSGMTGKRDLFISAVIHQAYVDVNEEGTEAAAATGVVMKLTSMGPDRTPVFRADHPFIFMIRDAKSGSILFLGRVLNPKT
ncbi:MAG: serpin family protein [Sedimentisphaerales bacterium]|nr:serpin family protein [Sedimentisphaerales bacterium]